MSRLLDIIAQEIPARAGVPASARVELRSLAGQVTQLARIAHETEVILEPGPEVTVEASPALLWRVLTNVVDNAARAAGAYGRVAITVSARGDQAIIDVIDDGPGFGQGPPGAASLGLGVVTTLLESCGGVLEIRAPESGGAHVRIVVPVRPPPGRSRPRREAPGGPVTGLVIGDDHSVFLDAMSAVLEQRGYEVTVARSVPETIEAVRRTPAGRVPDRPEFRRRRRDHGHQPDARRQQPDQGAGGQCGPGHRRDPPGPARPGRPATCTKPGGCPR